MKRKSKIMLIVLSVFILIAVGVLIRGLWENNHPEITHTVIKSDRLPNSFKGYKIAQVSDLHNAKIGGDNQRVLDLLKDANPDIIVFTGDIVDSRKTDFEVAVDFAKRAEEIAPCYYVCGNHESRLTNYQTLVNRLEGVGVTVLQNQKIRLELDGEYITLLGIVDPAFYNEYPSEQDDEYVATTLANLLRADDGFRVALSHRPELINTYAQFDLDVVFSGHAHGGQFILPLIGGLFAPNQGLFPDYTQGVHTVENTKLVISRGVGNSAFPFRFNNRPEVVLVEFQK